MKKRGTYDREDLCRLMDSLGGDLSRWPDEARRQVLQMAGEDGELARGLQEASAIDRLLAAGEGVAATQADERRNNRVADQIMGRIEAERLPSSGAVGGRLPASGGRRQLSGPAWLTGPWPEALQLQAVGGLLAASLVLGVMAGTSGWVDQAASPMAAMIGLDAGGDAMLVEVDDDLFGLAGLPEDFL